MEVTIIRFNRPLLIRTGRCKGDYLYQPVYGFLIPEYCLDDEQDIEGYVGYLACLHDWSNGGTSFTMNYEVENKPLLEDWNGGVHLKSDAWTRRMGKECIKKLELSYVELTIEVDQDTLEENISEDNLIICDFPHFFMESTLKGYSSLCEETPDDELPF